MDYNLEGLEPEKKYNLEGLSSLEQYNFKDLTPEVPQEVQEDPRLYGIPEGAGEPISTITGKPVPTAEEEFAGAKAVMNLLPHAFASFTRGMIPEALETAIMQPVTKLITGRDYISPITEAQKVSGAFLPKAAKEVVGIPAQMAGVVVPLSVAFKTADAALKTIGLSAKAMKDTAIVNQLTYHIIRGGTAGGIYGGIAEGTVKGMAKDAALFAVLDGVFGTAAPIIDKISKANWYRRLSIKERGLVTEKIAKQYREGMTEADVLRFLGKESEVYKAALAAREVKPTPVKEAPYEIPTATEITGKEKLLAKFQEAKIKKTELRIISEDVYGSKKGLPFKNEGIAKLNQNKIAKELDVTPETLTMISVKDGFAWQEKPEVEPIEPEVVREVIEPTEIKPEIIKPAPIEPKVALEVEKPVKEVAIEKVKEPLIKEAKKYKTAEEFVEAQGRVYHQSQSKEPIVKFKQRDEEGYKKAYYSQAGEGIYFSPNKELVQSKYGKEGGQLVEATLQPKKTLDLGDKDAMYFDGTKVNSGEIVVENFKRQQRGEIKVPEPDIELSTITKKAKKWLVERGYDSVEGMKGKMWSAPEIVVLDESIIKTKSQLTDIWNKAQAKPRLLKPPKKPPEAVREEIKGEIAVKKPTTPSKGKYPSNTVFYEIRGNTGNISEVLTKKYDGTTKDLKHVAKELKKEAGQKYFDIDDYSNIQSRFAGTDKGGNVRYTISPNLEHVGEVGTAKAGYILGDITAKPLPFKPPEVKPPEAVREEIKPKVIPEVKPKVEGVTLYTGLDPVLLKKTLKDISTTTQQIIKSAKMKPEIRHGIKSATDAMIEHDRNIRSAEFVSKQLKKTVKDVIPDKERQLLMVHAYEHKLKGKYWNQLTEIEKGVVRWAAEEKTKLNKYIKDNDVLEMMEIKNINHIFHHWINPKTGKSYTAVYGKFSKGLPQAKQRTIPTYEAGIKKGLTPATVNLGELIGLEWEAATRANNARQLIKVLHGVKGDKEMSIVLQKGKEPQPVRMIERWDLLKKQGIDESYVRYDNQFLDKTLTFKSSDGRTVTIKGAIGVRKELYPFVYAYIETPAYGTLSNLNFATKSLKLGMSLFHVISLGMQELANLRMPFVHIPKGLKITKELGSVVKLLHQEGLELFKGYEDLGYQNKFFEGTTKLGKIGNVATWPIEKMRNFIFNYVQPGIKTSFADMQFRKMLPRYLKKAKSKLNAEEVMGLYEKGKPIPEVALKCARDVVLKADGHFSGEHYKRSLLETNRFMVKLYFTPEARKAWQVALLSPTWQREHLLIAKNVAKSFMPDSMIKKLGLAEIGPIKSQYRRYLLGGVMIIGAVDLWNQMSTEIMDGESKHIWENPPGKGFAVRAWWNEPDYTIITKDGQKRKIKGGPGYIRPLKSLFEVAEWAHDPFKKFSYKLSPVVSAIGTQLFGIKEYGGLVGLPIRLFDFMLHVTTPIVVSQLILTTKGKKAWQGTVTAFFGMPASKAKKKKESLTRFGKKKLSERWGKKKTRFEGKKQLSKRWK